MVNSKMMDSRKSALGCILFLAISAIKCAVSLKCYSCSDALNLHECKSAEKCNEGQVCYKRRQFTSQVQFDLGCIDKEECGRYANTSGNAKMGADKTSYCYECCSKDRCNQDLCEYPPHSLCKDDTYVDCAKLNSMFSICEVTSEAKKICPKFCNLCNMVDGNWSPWSSWSSCDVTCGKGSLVRHRTCSNPSPQHGGLDCPGKSTESKLCQLQPCPVHGGWSSWDNWGKCSTSCGTGLRSRKRSCTNPRPQRSGDHCFGDSTEYESCINGSCAVNGGWSSWSTWEQCSVSCAIGLQSRTRSCTNPKSVNAGDLCFGTNFDVRLCNRFLCPEWTTWQSWSSCYIRLGGRLIKPHSQTRKRTCSKNQLSADCLGNSTETRKC